MEFYSSYCQKKRTDKKEIDLEKRILRTRELIEQADFIVIGAGSGLSTAAGLDFGGERFSEHMGEFGQRYGYSDMYSGDFYDYKTPEEFWAFEAKTILINRFEVPGLPLYLRLYDLVKDKNYFVLTTNVESQFAKSGFANERIFATQGDYGLLQCANGCHQTLYDNEKLVREMVEQTRDCAIPSRLVPTCPICHNKMKVNLRSDGYFVEDDRWHGACGRYESFIKNIGHKRVVYLEFGVGYNTPGIIRYPFERFTYANPNAYLIRLNLDYPDGIVENKARTISFTEDISAVLEALYPNKHEGEINDEF